MGVRIVGAGAIRWTIGRRLGASRAASIRALVHGGILQTLHDHGWQFLPTNERLQ
jgi:hypothetical protein